MKPLIIILAAVILLGAGCQQNYSEDLRYQARLDLRMEIYCKEKHGEWRDDLKLCEDAENKVCQGRMCEVVVNPIVQEDGCVYGKTKTFCGTFSIEKLTH